MKKPIYVAGDQTLGADNMKKLAAGYFLSALNSLCLSPLVVYLIYPAIVTYPASIVLRGIGWRSLRNMLGKAASMHLILWVFGGLTYVFVLIALVRAISEILTVAALFWSLYSVAEAILYVTAARRLAVPMFYASPVSLVGVVVFEVIVLSGQAMLLQEAKVMQVMYLGTAALFVSALNSAVASLKLTRRELVSPASYPTALPQSGYTAAARPAFERTALRGQPLLKLEVVRRSKGITCRTCHAVNPVEAKECLSCGAPFVKTGAGLRCPVCNAPFYLAKKIEAQRYLCGQCASTLSVKSV